MVQKGDEEDGEGSTERRYCTLSAPTIRRLEVLAARGTHGTTVSKVMVTLIEQGIRDAIEKKYIEIDDHEA